MGLSVLVAGVGNVFFGDDGFGVEVARRMARAPLHRSAAEVEVKVVDYGIRSFDLACALTSGIDAAVIVDALSRGDRPGTLYVVDPVRDALPVATDMHSMHPAAVLALAGSLGTLPPFVRVVGCEPARFVGESPERSDASLVDLSAEVGQSVDAAVALVREIVTTLAKEVGRA